MKYKPRKSKDQTFLFSSKECCTLIIPKTILCLVLDSEGKCFHEVVHGDFRYSTTFQRRLLQVYSLLCHHMLDHYKGGVAWPGFNLDSQNMIAQSDSVCDFLLPFKVVNQTFLNIWNITYTQTTSTKIRIGLSLQWVEIGFADIHATHGSHTIPGRFLGPWKSPKFGATKFLEVLS